MEVVEQASTSTSKLQDEEAVIISELEDLLMIHSKNNNKKENGEENKEIEAKPTRKRKRTSDEHMMLDDIISIFLRIVYPLSKCMRKYVVVGIDKTQDCKPVIMINQNGKNIVLNVSAWNSLDKHMQLIDCYFNNKIFGKKTSFNLFASNIEIDNIILRGEQYVRMKDLTKHDLKIQLTYDEFFMLHSASAAINNYINQLHLVESCCKDYITSTIDTLPTLQILYSPLDTSIMNRLPQEVELYRHVEKMTVEKTKNLHKDIKLELESESNESVIE